METRRRLDLASVRSLQPESDPWLTASRLLVEARLLVAAGQPDAATRLLAGASELASVARTSGWLSDLVTIARAEALLASGEPQRALALVTPLPPRAVVEASVVTAAARRSIGDARGAQAVLAGAVAGLESAPLAWQIQAWLLESRLAEDRRTSTIGPDSCWIVPSGWPPQSRCEGPSSRTGAGFVPSSTETRP